MTLLLSAVTPEGIVMGADSALTWRELGDQINLMGFNKIIPVSRLNMGVSIAGAARIGREGRSAWLSTWLRQYVEDVSHAESFSAFCTELTAALNETADEDATHTLQLGAWVLANHPDSRIETAPRLAEITRVDDQYRWRSLLPDEFTLDIVEWRRGNQAKGYPVQFASSGLPSNYATWIATVGTPGYSQLLGARIPDPQITSVAEYVRFLIRNVAELYRIARQPAYVGEPVETLILFPDSKTMFSTRY
jgi:hypothetical protein